MGTILGPKSGTRFASFLRRQVRDFYAWTHWLYGVVLRGRDYVTANLNETAAVLMAIARRLGHVVNLPLGRARAQLFERIARHQSRGHCALMARASSRASLQAQLPQFLLTRDTTLPAGGAAARLRRRRWHRPRQRGSGFQVRPTCRHRLR
jgi:hypothetical protein